MSCPYTIYDTATGAVLSTGVVSSEELARKQPVGPGQTLLVGVHAPGVCYIEDGKVVSAGWPPEYYMTFDHGIRQWVDARGYDRKREAEYPPLADLADALVHQARGDEGPLAAYLARCEAVKAAHPKPTTTP